MSHAVCPLLDVTRVNCVTPLCPVHYVTHSVSSPWRHSCQLFHTSVSCPLCHTHCVLSLMSLVSTVSHLCVLSTMSQTVCPLFDITPVSCVTPLCPVHCHFQCVLCCVPTTSLTETSECDDLNPVYFIIFSDFSQVNHGAEDSGTGCCHSLHRTSWDVNRIHVFHGRARSRAMAARWVSDQHKAATQQVSQTTCRVTS